MTEFQKGYVKGLKEAAELVKREQETWAVGDDLYALPTHRLRASLAAALGSVRTVLLFRAKELK